jgi:dsDNA-specific endonuclease/ATPase MutS2
VDEVYIKVIKMVHKRKKFKVGDRVILKETGEFFTIEEITQDGEIGITTEGLSLWVNEEDIR